MSALLSFDRSAIEAHVSLLHDMAEGLDGVLILAAFEEGGLPNVQRFGIGDVTNMVDTIMGFGCHPRVNLYIPWAVMRRDLEPCKKGTEADVVSTLAAVGDIDGDKGIKTELPVEAPYIVESSPGNFQPVYIFERPFPPGEAKPVLTALCDFIGGDSATKDCSHVWRIPGTLNIPTKSKLARGRSPVPAAVAIKKQYDGGFVSPAALLALAPPPRLPNGHDTAPSGPLSFAEEARLRGALAVIPAEDRDTWVKIGAALWRRGARAVWDDWSKKSGKFDAADQDRVWDSFHGGRKERIATIASIFTLAEERGWVPPDAGDAGTDSNLELDIARLSKLSIVEYERVRITAAETLCVRAWVLDKLVKDARPAETGQGRPLELPSPEPWPSPVDGAALVSQLVGAIRRYVVLTESDALAAALWVLHVYCFEIFPCTPRLAITAPEKRCGKTTFLDVLMCLVQRALSTANISAAATFRTIEAVRPTLLIDEADTFLAENEDLRGILNSGHRAGGQVIRTVGDDFEPRVFSTHCPVAIAQIGKLPSTLADRSINVSMKRRSRDEVVRRFRIGRTLDLVECARKAARWVADNAGAIRACDPDIPDAIFNRAADNWSPLIAIAEVAGGGIPERAKKAALASCGIEEELSYGAMLLADIRDVFEEKSCDRMGSKDLVAALVAMKERPWGECNHGKELTQNGLARRLKPFGVFTKDIGPEHGRLKGYTLESFADVFARYIPPSAAAQPRNECKIKGLDEKQTAQQSYGCADANSSNRLNLNDLRGCADGNPQSGDARECAPDLGTDGDSWENGF